MCEREICNRPFNYTEFGKTLIHLKQCFSNSGTGLLGRLVVLNKLSWESRHCCEVVLSWGVSGVF